MANDELVIHLEDENFFGFVSKGVTLVDFYAEWCGPCRMLSPILEKVAESLKGKANIVKVDTDKATETAAKFSVTSVPTLVLFKDGKEVNRAVGLKDESSLEEFISAVL